MAESTLACRSASRELSSSQADLWAEEELPGAGARAMGRGQVEALTPQDRLWVWALRVRQPVTQQGLTQKSGVEWGLHLGRGRGEPTVSELSGGRSPLWPQEVTASTRK